MAAIKKCFMVLFIVGIYSGWADAKPSAPREWISESLFPHLIDFEGWKEPNAPQQNPLTESVSLPVAPNHGLFGFVTIAPPPADKFPIHVTYYYGDVRPEDARAPGVLPKNSAIQWGDRIGVKTRLPRADAVQIRTTIPAGASLRIPAYNLPIQAPQVPGQPSGTSLWIDLRDRDDNLLAYRCLIDAYFEGYYYAFAAPQAFTTDDPEAERFFSERSLSNISRQRLLPEDWPFYMNARAVWFSRLNLNQDLPRNFYRRLLLAGVFLVGRSDAAFPLAQKAGIPPGAGVLNAGIAATSDADDPLRIHIPPHYFPQAGNLGTLSAEMPVASQPIAASLMRQLRNYTLGALGGYVIVVASILIIGFTWLQGRRRIFLWIATPAFALLTTVLIWLLAPRFIDFKERAQAVRYDYSWSDWPESYVEMNFTYLQFLEREAVWEFPSQTEIVDLQGQHRGGLGHRGAPGYRISHTPAKTVFRTPTERGHLTSLAGYTFVESRPPVQLVGRHQWKFSESFDKAWGWTGNAWKNLGQVTQGDIKDVSQAPDLFDAADFKSFATATPAPGSIISHTSFEQLPGRVRILSDSRMMSGSRMKGQAILIGVRKNADLPRPAWKKAGEFSSTLVRVHGFPLNEPGATGRTR